MLKKSVLTLLIFVSVSLSAVFPGELEDFQEGMDTEKKTPPKKEKPVPPKRDSEPDPFEEENPEMDPVAGSLWALAAIILFPAIPFFAMAESWNYSTKYKISGFDYLEKIPTRKPGDSRVPYLQTGVTGQFVGHDVFGLDGTAELGFGFLHFKYHHLQYFERDPSDSLSFDVFAFMVRMSYFTKFELSVGSGFVYSFGNTQRNYTLFTFPLKIFFGKHVMFEYIPEFYFAPDRYTVNNHELALSFNIRYFSIQAGYKFVFVSGEEMNGFILSVLFRL